MPSTKLIPYTVQIHPRRETDSEDYWNLTDLEQYETSVQSTLSSIDDSTVHGIDTFSDLIAAFCNHYQSDLLDLGEESDKFQSVTFALSSDWEGSNKVVEGNLYLGEYGVIRSIVNTQTGNRQERGRDVDDAEEKPLYFLAYTPREKTTTAYLLLERSRNYGAKEAFQYTLSYWINQNYTDDVVVVVEPVKTKDIFPKIRDADRTVRLRFEKDGSPGNLHSRFESVFEEDEFNQAIEYRPPGGDDMGLVVDELEDWYQEQPNAFETIDGISYNNVKITIEKNDSEETISLSKGEAKLRKNIDLSDIADEGDIPVLSEISSRAHGFLNTVTRSPTNTTSLFD